MRRADRDYLTRSIRPQNRIPGTQRPPAAQHPARNTHTEDSMASRPAAPPPHPLVEQVDWDAIQQEAAQALSAYVKLDSSHPVGQTTHTAKRIADRLASEGIDSKIYETPDPNKVNLVARLTA